MFMASPERRSSLPIGKLTQPIDSVVYRATPQAALTYAEQSIPRPGELPPQTYGVESTAAARSRIAWRMTSDASGGGAAASGAGCSTTGAGGGGAAGAFGPFGSARNESKDARMTGASAAQLSSAVTARMTRRRSVSRATK